VVVWVVGPPSAQAAIEILNPIAMANVAHKLRALKEGMNPLSLAQN
jgi:hypothetical protein